MKVLITDFDLFAKVGGGQTFYRSLLKNFNIDSSAKNMKLESYIIVLIPMIFNET